MKISDVMRQSAQILDMIGDNQEPSLPGDFYDNDQNLVYKYGRHTSGREIATVATVIENNQSDGKKQFQDDACLRESPMRSVNNASGLSQDRVRNIQSKYVDPKTGNVVIYSG